MPWYMTSLGPHCPKGCWPDKNSLPIAVFLHLHLSETALNVVTLHNPGRLSEFKEGHISLKQTSPLTVRVASADSFSTLMGQLMLFSHDRFSHDRL